MVELIFLELAFELIREAGVRVPGSLGNAIGIVGGLVIGQAAVEANLVSPIVVMIVALTALGSMTVPNEEFAAAFRLVKYGFLILGGYLGIYGIVHNRSCKYQDLHYDGKFLQKPESGRKEAGGCKR